MNVHTEPQLTPAETALAEAFATRLSDLPGNEDVTLRRDAAMEIVKRGLPTRKVESWHYTDLRRLLAAAPEYDRGAAAETVPVLVEGSSQLVVVNGRAKAAEAPDGVSIEQISKLLPSGQHADELDEETLRVLFPALERLLR